MIRNSLGHAKLILWSMDFAVKKLVRADDIFLHVQIFFLSLDTRSKKMVRAGIVFCFFRHRFSKIPYERGLF